MEQVRNYRKAGVAGSFYSRDKLILERELSMLLESAPVLELPRPIRAIVAPHAGYLYSGGVAARAYGQLLNSSYRRVIILAASHEESFPFCSIYSGLGYNTPLGEVPIDEIFTEKLTNFSLQIQLSETGHTQVEHAIEVQLPFLQLCLRKFSLIPIMMGEQSMNLIEALVEAVVKIVPAEGTLIVASTDLSHGHSDHKARLLDQVAVEAINQFDEKLLWREIQEKQTEMCGYGPVIASIKIAKKMGAREAKVLMYRHSGDISGNNDEVVGYLSAIMV
ncbi:MAG: AmmeMemoRadiSam system protein B [Caldithrix sp. RBG_13_44_9]|nr:MAG: AmmeMemoRadiSam system protein B [Caldithrix sp. RBG_13_44_9]